ncbi:TetR/AcrR family transcriptional regulator [Actinomadura atramentaria]|uniref:TetR/AcrR family transcriptional regulator n=1 Tax=Actinomadura atramentaria TaxID=1990 RepID=UPI000477C1D6|nr:TetR/AcrR family transcriptional regulator [Actinomadura atramentaria]
MGERVGARERIRRQMVAEIKREARRQLAESGAQSLSLRAVARETGLVSSGVYRYFASRDELLTALIIDAYGAVAERVEEAVGARAAPRERWRAGCAAVRAWSRANPHEYALIYGSPVPGYAAPADTVDAAARVPLALLSVVRAAHEAGELRPPDVRALPPELAAQGRAVAELTGGGLPEDAAVRVGIAWTQLFGMVGFELFGHLVGSFDPADALFDHAVDLMADLIGLP